MLFNHLTKAKKDFEVSDLPSNRKEVIIDILRNDYFFLLKLGGLLLIFAIPLLASVVSKDFILLTLGNMLGNDEISQDTYNNLVNTLRLIYHGAMGLSFIIFSLGLAGVIRIIRQRIWQKPIFLAHDFIDGIKLNWKQYFLFSLIFALAYVGKELTAFIPNCPPWLIGAVYVIFYGVILPLTMLQFVFAQIYTNSFFKNVKYSLQLYFSHLIVFFLLGMLCYIAIFTQYIPILFLKYILVVFFIVVLLPQILMIKMNYDFFIFDLHINKDSFPEIFDLGIHRHIDGK